VAIDDWDDNDYTYLSPNKEDVFNFIYKPGKPFTKQQVLAAEATLAYIQKMDSVYGSGNPHDDDETDEQIHWFNDRNLLRVVLNPGLSKGHPIFDGMAHYT